MATGMLQEPPNSVHVAHLFPRLGLQHKASRAFEIRDGFQIPQTGHIIHCDAWWVHFVCVHFQTVIKRNVSLLQLKQQLVWSYVQAFHKTGSKSTRRKMNAQTVDRVKHFQEACRSRLIDYPMFKVYAYKTSINIHQVFTAPWCPRQKLEYIYTLGTCSWVILYGLRVIVSCLILRLKLRVQFLQLTADHAGLCRGQDGGISFLKIKDVIFIGSRVNPFSSAQSVTIQTKLNLPLTHCDCRT